jgi:hypothetical protein
VLPLSQIKGLLWVLTAFNPQKIIHLDERLTLISTPNGGEEGLKNNNP